MKQRTIVSRTGEIFLVRPMEPADDEMVAAGFERLSAKTLQRRFFTDGVGQRSRAELVEVVGLHPGEHVLLAFDRSGTLAGGIRLIPSAEVPGSTEVAITIDDRRQAAGIGARLFDLGLADALELGFRSVRGHVLVENRPARSLVGRAGGHLWFDEPGVLAFEIPLAIDQWLIDDAIARSLQAAS